MTRKTQKRKPKRKPAKASKASILASKRPKKGKKSKSFPDSTVIVYQRVANILLTMPETRDDDRLLMLEYWRRQGLKPNTRAFIFAQRLLDGIYTLPETIRRSRQYLQEKHECLRGALYDERHKQEKRRRAEMARMQTRLNFDIDFLLHDQTL